MATYTSTYTGEVINNGIGKTVAMACGTCATAADTAAKAASVVGFPNNSTDLETKGIGVPVTIKFTNNVNANATLNINSSGAHSIIYKGAALINGIIKAGYTVTFIYDGTNYQLVAGGGIEAEVTGTTLVLG